MTEGSFRGFIALPSPKPLTEKLETLQQELKPLGLDAKWVTPSQIHLTLKFLGETSFSLLEKWKESLDGIAGRRNAFSFRIERFGAFPDFRRPRVLWVGSGEVPSELQELAGMIEAEAVRFGFEKETRAFKAHLTLARLRSPQNGPRLEAWATEHPAPLREEFPCGRVILFQSTLTPHGPIYQPLHEVTLKGS